MKILGEMGIHIELEIQNQRDKRSQFMGTVEVLLGDRHISRMLEGKLLCTCVTPAHLHGV